MSAINPVVPLWQPDESVQECFICQKPYTFFFRRHHCRRCGKVVCGNCSTTKTIYDSQTPLVPNPTQLFQEPTDVPHRTCDVCVEEIILEEHDREDARVGFRSHPVQVPAGLFRRSVKHVNQERTYHIDEQLVADRVSERDCCPICGENLSSKEDLQREEHINDCLIKAEFSGSPDQPRNVSNRMLVYRIADVDQRVAIVSCSDTSMNTQHNDEKLQSEECVICLEEFLPGDKVGRLECLCVFHYNCIKNWFKRKGPGECPTHAVHI